MMLCDLVEPAMRAAQHGDPRMVLLWKLVILLLQITFPLVPGTSGAFQMECLIVMSIELITQILLILA